MKIPFQALLTIPFLLELFVVISLVGLVSDINSQRSVKEIVEQLNEETSERVYQRIQLYLTTPHLINELNYKDYESGEVNLSDNAALERRFWNQINSFQAANQDGSPQSDLNKSVNNIYFARANGTLHGAEYNKAKKQPRIMIMRADSTTSNILKLFVATKDGKATDQSETRSNKPENDGGKYDARDRPWFDNVNSGDTPSWSTIYGDFTDPKSLVITATRPVFDSKGNLVGIFASDLLFSEINEFLENLDISKNGRVFLVTRDGEILNSPSKPPLNTAISTGSTNKPSLQKLGNSKNDLLDSAAFCLRNEYKDLGIESLGFLNEIQEEKSLECKSSATFFLQVRPITDEHGLDWLMLLIIPKSDVMGQVYRNRSSTLVFLILALGITAWIGIMTARWLAQPVLKLKEATSLLSDSIDQDLPPIEVKNPSELGALADSFQHMAERLKKSFLNQKKLSLAYERFVPKRLVEILGKEIIDVKLGDDVEQEGASILFADIRDFTSLSEGMVAKDNFDFINAYLSRMEPAITENHGFIDKYIGDAIMAIFPGVVKSDEALTTEDISNPEGIADNAFERDSDLLHGRKAYDSADNAIKTAISMLERLDKYNKSRNTKHRKAIRIGIGINTGTVRLGTVGGYNRMDGTVISDEVNLASRLESLTKRFGVPLIISEKTLKSLKDENAYHQRFLGSVRVKGRLQSVEIYEVFEGESNSLIEKKLKSKPFFENAIRLYQKKDFAQAANLFQQSLELCPDDRAALYYLDRCSIHLQDGVSEDWVGVEEF